MRLLPIILLLLASCSSVQPQPKTSKSSEKDTTSDKSPGNRSAAPAVNQQITAPIGATSNADNGEHPGSEERIAVYTEKLASYTQALANYTLFLAVVTALLVAVGVFQFVALKDQVNALRHHSDLIGDSVEQMRKTVAAYERYVGVGEQALALTRQSNETTRDATHLTKQSFLLAYRPKLIVRNIVSNVELGLGLIPDGTFRIVNEGGTAARCQRRSKIPQFPPVENSPLRRLKNPQV